MEDGIEIGMIKISVRAVFGGREWAGGREADAKVHLLG